MTPAIVDTILSRLGQGESLRAICADETKIVEQRLAEKARIDTGKPIEKSWLNLPDNRRSLDLAHMRGLRCSDVPNQ